VPPVVASKGRGPRPIGQARQTSNSLFARRETSLRHIGSVTWITHTSHHCDEGLRTDGAQMLEPSTSGAARTKQSGTETPKGYLHPDYAASLAEFGTPLQLPRCRGWLLERQIPGFAARDAMGCYPVFVCGDWSRLSSDLDSLDRELVTVSLVADVFAPYDQATLSEIFDRVVAFKRHFIVDLELPIEKTTSANHRWRARKALREVSVEICDDPRAHVDEWFELFTHLVARHGVRGLRAFSHRCFERQARIPGFLMVRARYRGRTVGVQTLYTNDDVAYGHIMAMNEEGYELSASYAMTWIALEHLVGKVRYIDIGGTSGVVDRENDGLFAYKRGWTSTTRPAYFCGRILDPEQYSEISPQSARAGGYFPAYRSGEFA